MTAGPWEKFQIEWLAPDQLAIKTPDGAHYLTAVNGGGIGGPNDATCPVHTDATVVGPWEQLILNHDEATNTATLETTNGHFLTAVGGGGIPGPNTVPVHTDAVAVGPWETFSAVAVAPPPGIL